MKLKYFLLCTLIVSLLSTCETEIDITGPYQRIPVVYGLLDKSEEVQFIMINRTFLGTGNALDMAQVEDSMLYSEVDAQIRVINGSGLEVGSVTLTDTILENKDINGLFYAPTHKVYFAPTSAFDSYWNDPADNNFDYRYELDIIADGQEITSSTPLATAINNAGIGAINLPLEGDNVGGIKLVNNFNPAGSIYEGNFRVKWNGALNTAVKNSIKQKMDVRFNYREVYTDESGRSPAWKSVKFPYFQLDVETLNSTQTIEEGKSGEFFFLQIADRISDDPDLKYREIGEFEFILSVAGEDFTTYLNIGDPVSAVGQARPTFSNINNGDAIGIFSSRNTFTLSKKLYTDGGEADVEEMVRGQHTGNLCFCDPTPGSSFDCAVPSNQCQ